MQLKELIAEGDRIVFVLDEEYNGTLTFREEVPLIHGPCMTVDASALRFSGGKACLSRRIGEHDRAFDRFIFLSAEKALGGVKYITRVSDPLCREPYPVLNTIKSLNCPYALGAPLGADQQGRPDINLPAFISLRKQEGTRPYRFEGQTYYIFEDAVAEMEEAIRDYKMSTVVVLNSPLRFGSKREKDMLDVCLHPKFEKDAPYAFISAFDMCSAEGQRVFAAFISFLAENYARPGMANGRITGAIISNEINLQDNWGNMGPVTPEYYMEEYTQALRTAWIAGARCYENFRVYISLANNWNMESTKPLRYYRGKQLIDLLCENCHRDGDFPWHVAFHPYPESFDHPDFWNDRSAVFTMTTPTITYRNMEVLERYLSRPKYLYRGEARRILFSEQGFNSGSGPLSGLMQKQAAAGYVLSFIKARQMKTVDMMTHHSTVDNPHEFGLNLGIYRYDPDKPFHRGEAKPIAEMVKVMDTPYEAAAIALAREVIGDELFDYLASPPEIVESPEDLSNDFGEV